MIRDATSALQRIDEAAGAVRRIGPICGILWLCALPSRLLLALFLARLIQLGPRAVRSGDSLTLLAYGVFATWLLAVYGRLVFVRAARAALQAEPRSLAAFLRIPPRELASAAAAALMVQTALWALLLTVVAPVALLVLGTLVMASAGVSANPSPARVLRTALGSSGSLLLLLRLLLIFGVALLLTCVNLHALAQAVLWAAQGAAGLDTTGWGAVVSPANPVHAALVLAGASLLIEPFWLAAFTAHVDAVRMRSSGADLRRWFDELRGAA